MNSNRESEGGRRPVIPASSYTHALPGVFQRRSTSYVLRDDYELTRLNIFAVFQCMAVNVFIDLRFLS